MVGFVLLLPPVIVAEPCALRNPLEVARIVYEPAGAVRLKVPSLLAVTEVTRVVPEYRLTVMGLPARTCPVREPSGTVVGVDDSTGVAVSTGVEEVGVAVSTGVEEVGVAVSTGVEEVGVAVSTGVEEVGVAVGEVNHSYVETICAKTADSAASS